MPTLHAPTRSLTSAPGVAPQQVDDLHAAERTTRILVVEDEPLTAEIFALALARDGHEVEVARDGLQALRRLDKRLPSAIVLDMNLPAVSGAEVIRHLRHEGHTDLPIVIVSGQSPSLSTLEQNEIEPGIWIEKPVKPRDLVRIVRGFVQDTIR